MLTFQELGLNQDVLKGIEELGFVKPTPIQEKIIPVVFNSGKDIVGLAQTGTGKTAAFGLPLIEQVSVDKKQVQVLVLAPTRELCMQIGSDFKNFSRHIKGLHILPVYGGANIESQIKALKKGVHIITATPGRMLDIINRKAVILDSIRFLVLDEADEMLNMGFREELDGILEKVPSTRRTLLFSATMPAEVARIARNYMNDPEEITIGRKNAGAENVRHQFYQVHARDRYLALKRIADINPDIYGIVFCRTRSETKEVADRLIKDGYNADALHGDLSQAQRDHVMKRFRERSLQMLVATDVAARGIDVSDITHIISYNLPDDLDIYTHRSGRTGRADKSGVSIAIVNFREKSRMPQIEKILGKKLEQLPVPSGAEICKKQLFSLIGKMQKVEIDEKQIAPFMDAVQKNLEYLSKEELIKRFVSLEFNRFLEYYKEAPDLNLHVEGGNVREKGKSRNKRERMNRKEEFQVHAKKGSNNRFFVNLGKKDGLDSRNFIRMINEGTKDRDIDIYDIDIKDIFSFFEVRKKHTDTILNSFYNTKFKGRHVKINLAREEKPEKRKKSHKRA